MVVSVWPGLEGTADEMPGGETGTIGGIGV